MTIHNTKPFELPNFEVPLDISSITQPDGLFWQVVIPRMEITLSIETSITTHTPEPYFLQYLAK